MCFALSMNCPCWGRNLSQVSRAPEYGPARHERVALGDRVFHHINSTYHRTMCLHHDNNNPRYRDCVSRNCERWREIWTQIYHYRSEPHWGYEAAPKTQLVWPE